MASYSRHSSGTSTILSSKQGLLDLMDYQGYVDDNLVDQVTRPKFIQALITLGTTITALSNFGRAGDIADAVFEVGGSLSANERESLAKSVRTAYNGMYDWKYSKWDKKEGVFSNNIVQARFEYPTVVYKNNSNGKLISFIVGKGTLVGAVDASGVELKQ